CLTAPSIRKSAFSEWPAHATMSRSFGVSWSVTQLSSSPSTIPTISTFPPRGSERSTTSWLIPVSRATNALIASAIALPPHRLHAGKQGRDGREARRSRLRPDHRPKDEPDACVVGRVGERRGLLGGDLQDGVTSAARTGRQDDEDVRGEQLQHGTLRGAA